MRIECVKGFLETMGKFTEELERGRVKGHTYYINRDAATSEAMDEEVEMVHGDVMRSCGFIRSKEEKDECRRYLEKVLAKVAKQGHYWQGMGDVCAPVVYAHMKSHSTALRTTRGSEKMERECFVLLERFFIPMMENGAALYKKMYGKLEHIPGYRRNANIAEGEGSQGVDAMLDLKHIVTWFERDLALDEKYKAYTYFLKKKIYQPFLFMLAAIEEIRGEEGKAIGAERLKRLFKKTNELEQRYGKEFYEFKILTAKRLIVVGAVSFGLLAVCLSFMCRPSKK